MVKILAYAKGDQKVLTCKVGTVTSGWKELSTVQVPRGLSSAEVGCVRCISRR